MTNAINNSASGWAGIGNVQSYASNLVKSYLADNSKTDAASSVSDFLAANSYQGTQEKTVASTLGFAKENVSNMKQLKSAASALENRARMIGVNAKAEDVVSAAENFASAYNNSIRHLTSGKADGAGVSRALDYVSDNRLTQGSAAKYGSYSASRLSSMGISIDQDGMMKIDSKKLAAAVEQRPNSVKTALSGYGSVTDTTQDNAARAMNIPAATYTDFSKMKVSNSLIDNLLPKTGFLFDISF